MPEHVVDEAAEALAGGPGGARDGLRRDYGNALASRRARRNCAARLEQRDCRGQQRPKERADRAGLEALPAASAEERGRRATGCRTALARLRARYEECSAATTIKVAQAADGRGARLAELARESESWAARAGSARTRLGELAERLDEAQTERAALDARPAELEARRAGSARHDRAGAEAITAAPSMPWRTLRTKRKRRRARLSRPRRRLGEAREAAAPVGRAHDRSHAGRDRSPTARSRSAWESAPERRAGDCGARPRWGAARCRGGGGQAPAPDPRAGEHRRRELAGGAGSGRTRRAHPRDAGVARRPAGGESGGLRRGIAGLNREGRERMLEAFGTIDGHFRQLFTELFGGGKAHLALVDSDDPLEAGLEVVASPPGKRPQSLSLLSGGEKALAAIALLFGAFLTNPAPICVLDEVDAPLDDSNVERFCTLITKLARGDRYPLRRRHAPSHHHGPSRPAVRRHHGGAGGLRARLGRSGARRGAARERLSANHPKFDCGANS